MSTVDLLRAHPPQTPDELRERVLALRPPERRRRVRVRPVLVLAAAATLAIAAAVVHGFRTSAPQPLEQHLPSTTVASVGSGGGATDSTRALAPKIAAAPAPAPGRLQHEDASVRIRVDDLGAATTQATRVAASLGGYAQSVLDNGSTSTLDLRIPTANVQKALVRLADLGTIVAQTISIEDLTNTLQVQSEQIAQLRRRVAALRTALRDPALPESQRVLLQIKLAESKRALAQRINGRKGTVRQAATSRVALVLTTRRAAAAPHREGRIGRMLHSALGFLAIEGLVLLFALIVASPVVLALGLVWFLRRRATDRLLVG